ncbi:GPI mannosyltransferase 3 [Trichuris trichiura]|uniref:Mannosyltransferase n=1 Tax=Trichuris trichiura TaxID=36087 RepID=A0A077YZH7_TRITR|nr:GPI mannosyltransferase 3 [Trichuris trichiura]
MTLPPFEKRTLAYFAIFYRALNLLLVQTWFVPDEYWQTLEPAHRLTFGYGYLTWEWQEGLRSYSYPCVFAALYKILYLLGLDTYFFMVPACCILAFFADQRLYALASQLFDQSTACWTMLAYYSNWFQFFCASRTLLNTVESALVIISSSYLIELTMKLNLAVVMLVTAFAALIDRLCYGHWTFPLWNFVQFNLIKGGSALFGSHPWHWYVTCGIPSVFLFHIIVIMAGVWTSKQNRFFFQICALYVLVHSLIAHKEFRFLLPTVPLLSIYAGYFLARNAFNALTKSKWVFGLLVLPNVLLALFTGLIHQRGVMDVTGFLNKQAQTRGVEIWYLMPCHSTPFYSHVHAPVQMRFLTCMPETLSQRVYIDESDNFHRDPSTWLERELSIAGRRPTHIVIYAKTASLVANVFRKENYSLIRKFFNTCFPQGDRESTEIEVYEQITSPNRT